VSPHAGNASDQRSTSAREQKISTGLSLSHTTTENSTPDNDTHAHDENNTPNKHLPQALNNARRCDQRRLVMSLRPPLGAVFTLHDPRLGARRGAPRPRLSSSSRLIELSMSTHESTRGKRVKKSTGHTHTHRQRTAPPTTTHTRTPQTNTSHKHLTTLEGVINADS